MVPLARREQFRSEHLPSLLWLPYLVTLGFKYKGERERELLILLNFSHYSYLCLFSIKGLLVIEALIFLCFEMLPLDL